MEENDVDQGVIVTADSPNDDGSYNSTYDFLIADLYGDMCPDYGDEWYEDYDEEWHEDSHEDSNEDYGLRSDIEEELSDSSDPDIQAWLLAYRNDGIGLINVLDEGAQINGKLGGSPPLMAAIFRHHFAIVCLLVDRGANVNYVEVQSDWTPIQYAAKCRDLQILKYLVARGADVNAADILGKSALCYAVEESFSEMAEFLISKGADINNVRGGVTPLSLAKIDHDHNMIALLRHHGAAED
eukprot:CAMPEP_0184697672 /NCGR_PEP_ID=MMETSP0313-20130426/4570_1 /TAXON_ID=2792 /ORGANISM="Porphyridium aerugineum, Strain SAG 1380-2" /LENGTH=240 /DNA_ID=CAMNT_0027156501 /DNA_START=185 /DNA_END=907 /DNA_ORIENTATION=+